MRSTAPALLVCTLLPALAPGAQSASPSFECSKASTRIEKLICASDELSKLDKSLADAYRKAKLRDPKGLERLQRSQREWLKENETSCQNLQDKVPSRFLGNKVWPSCEEELKARYRERLGLLELDVSEPLTEDKVAKAVQYLSALRAPDAELEAQLSDCKLLIKLNDAYDMSPISCAFFRKDPHAASRVLSSCYGSNEDNFLPRCEDISLARLIPEAGALTRLLHEMYGEGGGGSMAYGDYLNARVLDILAVVDPDPDLETYRKEKADHEAAWANEVRDLGYEPSLKHWSLQGNWEKREYAAYLSTLAVAGEKMRRYYMDSFHVDAKRAGELADYYTGRLTDSLGGHTGASSTLWYASLCLGLKDVDRFLKTGQAEVKCPDAEYADTSRPATLDRLLGLAIVNDYPLADIRKLLDEGAKADGYSSPKDAKNTRETPLMLAAPRPDVIRLLLERGADPRVQNGFGKTALMYAVQERNVESVKLLLPGSDVNAATFAEPEFGTYALRAGSRTALMYAAWEGTPEIARLLLDGGADPGRRDTSDETAADYVRKNELLGPAQAAEMKALFK